MQRKIIRVLGFDTVVKHGYRLVFRYFNAAAKNAFSFFIYYVKFSALFLTIQKRFVQRQDILLSFLFAKNLIN